MTDKAKLRADMPASTASILNARTLEDDFKRVYKILEKLDLVHNESSAFACEVKILKSFRP